MDPKKLDYREMKRRQLEDLRNNVCNYHIYKEFSTPFTYVFLKLGISPNAITLSSILLVLAGFYFLSLGTYPGFIIGLLFFALFKIFDMSDGEVVRIQNTHSIEGAYYDRISHYAFSLCLAAGLGIGLYKMHQNEMYIFLGLSFAFVMIMENAMSDALKLFLKPSMGSSKNLKKDLKGMGKAVREKFQNYMHQGKSWEKGSFISKIAGIYPFQGLAYSDSTMIPAFMALAFVEYSLTTFFSISLGLYGYIISLMATYILLIIISKTLWILAFIYKLEKNRPITNAVEKIK